MTRLAGTADARFVRFVLALGLLISLVITPFAHALAMPVAQADALPANEAVMACHNADQADPPENQTSDCCCESETACHCAAPIALPAATRTLATAPIATYYVVLPHFATGNLPPPEPPPPRG